MENRYNILYKDDKQKCCENLPIMLDTYALLLDRKTGNKLLLFKWKNTSSKDKVIIKMNITIQEQDEKGETINSFEYEYLDLHAQGGENFGAKKPIRIQEENAKNFKFKIDEIGYFDGTKAEGYEFLTDIEEPCPIDALNGLKEIFTLKYQELIGMNIVGKLMPTEVVGHWYCTCDALNYKSNAQCNACGVNKNDLFGLLDEDSLMQDKKIMEEKAKEKSKRTKRIIKTTGVAGVIVALIAVIITVVASVNDVMASKDAMYYLKKGDFEQAYKEFHITYGNMNEWPSSLNDEYSDAIENLYNEGKYTEIVDAILTGHIPDIDDEYVLKAYVEDEGTYHSIGTYEGDVLVMEGYITECISGGVKIKPINSHTGIDTVIVKFDGSEYNSLEVGEKIKIVGISDESYNLEKTLLIKKAYVVSE